MSRREFHHEGESKFWAVTPDGARFFLEFGKIGSKGQKQIKQCKSEADAELAMEKMITEKVKKGYEEVNGEGKATVKAALAPAAASKAAKTKGKEAAPVALVEAVPAPKPAKPARGAARSIDLDPGDWMWATWRPRTPVPLPAPQPFDLDDCVARLSRVPTRTYGWEWGFDRANIARSLSPEEAHFWLEAMAAATKELKPKQCAEQLAKKKWTGKLDPKQIVAKLKKARLSDEIVLPVAGLVSASGLVELMRDSKTMEAKWDNADHYLAGFRRYILPYLEDKELEALRKICRPAITPKNWPTDFYQRPPIDMILGALVGGLGKELLAVVQTWQDGTYQGEDWLDHYHKPQLIIFGLGSAAEVESQMRRMKLLLREPDQIRAWLAHTEAGALDLVRDSILAETNKEQADGLVSALALVHAPEAAPAMLALKLGSKAPAAARAWLEENMVHAVAGLLPTAAERGKLAEAAIDFLREARRTGHEETIRAALKGHGAEVADKVKRLVLEHVEKTYEPLDAKSTPKWLTEALAKVKRGKLPAWINPATLPPLVVGDRRLTDEQVAAALGALQASDLDAPHPLVAGLRDKGDREACDVFAWKLFESWLGEGAPSKEKWALSAVGLLGGDAAALKITPLIRAWPGESQHQRAVLGLGCLRAIGSDTALMQLNGIAQKLKFKALKQRAMECMEEIARGRGMTRAQLEDRIVPDCDLDERGSRVFDFGPRKFGFVLGPQMKPMVRDEEGKVKPDLPKPGVKDDAELAGRAVADWKLLKKQVAEVTKIQAVRLEQSMVTGRRWSVEEFQTLLVKHPLMTNLVRLLVWGGYDAKGALKLTFRVTEDQTCADAADETCALKGVATVGIVHPLTLPEGDKGRWGQVLGDYELVPPFAQIGRPVYTLEKGEDKKKELTRFKGPKIPAVSVVGTLEKLGWVRGIPQDGGVFFEHSKPFYGAEVTAVVQYGGIPVGYMIDWEDQEIERAFFVSGVYTPEMYPEHKNALALGKVDAIAVSETLADLTFLASKGK